MRRPHLGSEFGTELASNGNLQIATQVRHSTMRLKQNYKGSKIVAQVSTSTKFITVIFLFITARSFWIYNDLVDEEDKTIIFQLYPRFGNASFEDIMIQGIEHRYHSRSLLEVENSPMWKVKSIYFFFYIELNVAEKPYRMIIDSGSTLSWVNCKISHLDYGPSTKLGKLNGPYLPAHNKFVIEGSILCTKIKDWHDGTDHDGADHDDKFKFCGYRIEYGDDSSAKGMWVGDTIKYTTFMKRTTYQSVDANFGCTYEFDSKHLDANLDGVLGLQHLQDVSLASQFTTKIGVRDVFGHCISIKESEHATGYLIFGWYHTLAMSAEVEWVPMNEPKSFRQRLLKMHQLLYGEDELQVETGNIAFDTGGVQTYMREDFYNVLYNMMTEHARNLGYEQDDLIDSEGYEQRCWKVNTGIRPLVFNKITFRFEKGVDLKIPPTKFTRSVGKYHYCLELLVENLPSKESTPCEEEEFTPPEEEEPTPPEEEEPIPPEEEELSPLEEKESTPLEEEESTAIGEQESTKFVLVASLGDSSIFNKLSIHAGFQSRLDLFFINLLAHSL